MESFKFETDEIPLTVNVPCTVTLVVHELGVNGNGVCPPATRRGSPAGGGLPNLHAIVMMIHMAMEFADNRPLA